jgi:hypothetical protein
MAMADQKPRGLGFSFELGSELSFSISPDIGDTVIGLNLLAVALLLYLIGGKTKTTSPTPLPPTPTI